MRRVGLSFLLLSCAVLLTYCNQNMLAVQAGLGNLFRSQTGGSYVSQRYDQLNRASGTAQQSHAQESSQGHGAHSSSSALSASILGQANRSVRLPDASSCSCQTWGTCPKTHCDCSILCPNSFDILSITKDRHRPSKENSLAFTNRGEFFEDTHPLTAGYCWGHVAVEKAFNSHAFFDASKQGPDRRNAREWTRFYQDIIKRIMAGEAVVIPGYANLYAFSSDPDIQGLLTRKVARTWARRAIHISTLKHMVTEPMKPEQTDALFHEIQEKLRNNQAPTILATAQSSRALTHVMQVYDIRGDRLCLREPNYFQSSDDCSFFVRRNADGSLGYPVDYRFRSLGLVSIAPEDNADTVTSVEALLEKCRSEKGCG